jgi:hypothetical protein
MELILSHCERDISNRTKHSLENLASKQDIRIVKKQRTREA